MSYSPGRDLRKTFYAGQFPLTSKERIFLSEVSPAASAEREKAAFFDLAGELVRTSDGEELNRFKEELAQMTFGEP
jgi:hypothetical protein